MNRSLKYAVGLASVLAVTFFIYIKGVNGPYIYDDIPNLVDNEHLLLNRLDYRSITQAALSSPSSNFYRPLSMLTFTANYTLAGNKDPFSVKLTNIIIHLLNGVGVFLLTLLIYPRIARRRTDNRTADRSYLVALSTSSIWLLHPFYVSTVLYAIQRMAMLNAMFIIYPCLGYVLLRGRFNQQNRGCSTILILMVLCTVAGFLFKESTILLPCFLLIIEFFCFEFSFPGSLPIWKKRFFTAFLIVPLCLVLGVLVYNYFADNETAVLHYGFTAHERLLTQSRVLWSYAGWLIFLNPVPMSLFNDHIELSKTLFLPLTTFFSILAWAGSMSLGVIHYRKTGEKLLLFSVCWFLTGHLIESTTVPLLLMFEHRNYLPGYGILLGFSHLVVSVGSAIKNRKAIGYAIIVYICLLLPAYLLHERVDHWSSIRKLLTYSIQARPESTWAWVSFANHLDTDNDYQTALDMIGYLQKINGDSEVYIFNKAILHCYFRQEQKFDQDLISNLQGVDYNHIRTYSAFLSYRAVLEQCLSSRINYPELLGLYTIANKSVDNRISQYAAHAVYNLLEQDKSRTQYLSQDQNAADDIRRIIIDTPPQ